MASKSFYAIVAGVGPGTGGAVARRFAQAYPVVLLARHAESYAPLVSQIREAGGQAIGISADTADPAAVASAFASIEKELPGARLAAAVYNVGGSFARKPFLELTVENLDVSYQANPRGLFNFAQKAIPLLLQSVGEAPHPPSLLVTGATASLRGGATFAAFAPGQFAKRALAQSLAREFGPKGIHVAHIIIDAVIDIPRTKDYLVNNGAPDGKSSPEALADTYWYLHTQHRSAFTQELDTRPYVEKF